MPTPEQHALLSASSSARWLHCTQSARLAEQFPETTSGHAEAGRVAHSIAELKARKYFLEPMSTRAYNTQLKKLKEDPNYDKGMDGATDTYLDYLKALAMSFGAVQPFVALETRVDYGSYAPEGFGTADCLMIGAGRLCVTDYKNGSGVLVAAEHNSQMMLYALGALKVYAPIYGGTIQDIHLAIVQPNAGGVKEWDLTRGALEEWGETLVKPAAALAFSGEGEFSPGEWCDNSFCPARAQCTARARKMLELEDKYHFGLPAGKEDATAKSPGPLLTDDEVGDVLTLATELVSWYNGLKDYAETALLSGKPIPGWKLIEGRTSRKWTNLDAAFQTLQERGLNEAMLWERKPVTPPVLEKALGKKAYTESVEDLVTKTPGAPVLKPESDPRKPYNAAAMAFQVVDGGG